jgi:hypothetical protein
VTRRAAEGYALVALFGEREEEGAASLEPGP